MYPQIQSCILPLNKRCINKLGKVGPNNESTEKSLYWLVIFWHKDKTSDMSPAFNEPVVKWIIHLYLSWKLNIYNMPDLFTWFKNASFCGFVRPFEETFVLLCFFYKSDRLRGLFCVFGLMGLQVTALQMGCWEKGKKAKHLNPKESTI